MTVTQHSADNFTVSDVICNQLFKKQYLYYSREESIQEFKKEFAHEYELEKERELDMKGWEE